jgi:hypothetical protein
LLDAGREQESRGGRGTGEAREAGEEIQNFTPHLVISSPPHLLIPSSPHPLIPFCLFSQKPFIITMKIIAHPVEVV